MRTNVACRACVGGSVDRLSASDALARHEERPLKSLAKVLKVLDLFTDDKPQWRLQELSNVTRVPLPTMHRIVGVLREHGFLIQDQQSKAYRLGYAAIELGGRAARSLPLRQYAEVILRDLAARTGETMVLTVVNDARNRAVCIERIESRHDLRFHLNVGESSYLHAGASSRVLMAYFEPREIEQLCRTEGLPRLASATITDVRKLKAELARVRRQSYALSCSETNEGGWGVAVPVFDRSGQVIAGLGIAAPIWRMSPDVEVRYIELARQGATELGRTLGVAGAWAPGATEVAEPPRRSTDGLRPVTRNGRA